MKFKVGDKVMALPHAKAAIAALGSSGPFTVSQLDLEDELFLLEEGREWRFVEKDFKLFFSTQKLEENESIWNLMSEQNYED